MLCFGLALSLANIFFQSSLSLKTDSSITRFPRIKTINKCCSWGMSFDVNELICKATPRIYFPLNRDLYHFTFGAPDCVDTVLYSVVVRDFHVNQLKANGENAENYCIDENDAGTVVITCGNPSEVCAHRPCIRKCKPLGEFYVNEEDNEAVTTQQRGLSLVFYNLETLLPDESVTVSNFGVFLGLDCEGKLRLDHEESDVNYIGTNGSLYVPHYHTRLLREDEFCVDYVQGEGTFVFLCLPPRNESFDETEPEDPDDPDKKLHILLVVAFIASFVCLLATFFVYLFSRKSRSLYGKTVMFYVGCLCVAYLGLAFVQLEDEILNRRTCIIVGYSILWSFLAAFFWLNVMSIDIWKTFRPLEATEWRKTHKNRSRFTAYSIYAWGTPLAITLTCRILDALPRKGIISGLNMIRPEIGLKSCWFSGNTYALYVFFMAPVSLIIVCNIVLYVDTSWRCWKVKAEITRLGQQSGRSRGKYSIHREQLLLNGKLFIVMGVSWGPELLSMILPHPLWKITDVLNSLLGVFIFIVFILKKNVVGSVMQRVRHSLRSVSKSEHQSEYMMKNLCNDDMGKTPTTASM